MGKPCPTCNSEMRPVGAGPCPTCGQDSDVIRELFAAPPRGHAALHASAPEGCGCSDCAIDNEPCPACYAAWWKKRHPQTSDIEQLPRSDK